MNLNEKDYLVKMLMSVRRRGMKHLLEYMEENGFYISPCSTQYHSNCEGGLLTHTCKVIEYSIKLGKCLLKENFKEQKKSIILCAALHDLGKTGQFGKSLYTTNLLKDGSVSKAKPFVTNSELLYVDHEVRSIAIAQQFILLTEEEQFAILNHNGMYSSFKYSYAGKETPLSLIIHWADMWASHIAEDKKEEK